MPSSVAREPFLAERVPYRIFQNLGGGGGGRDIKKNYKKILKKKFRKKNKKYIFNT
jgi:hypothetical protein